MKYTYFSTLKAGKYLIRSQFWLNRRSCALIVPSNPLWCVLSKPVGVLDKLEWYWCDKETEELKHHEHYLDTRDKLTNAHYDEMWFPTPDPRGCYLIPRHLMSPARQNFYGCVDDILSRDLITNPIPLLGYTGLLGSEKQMTNMKNDNPNIIPPPHVIEELRKRKNLCVYKEDIRHMAYNFYAGNGQTKTSEETTEIINQARRFQQLIPKLLSRLDIPYEMFSLDTGDYTKTFNLEKTLPRNSTDSIFTQNEMNRPVMKLVDDYMRNYEKI
tara:strand:- start:945 stop:1757 length:813 start_codon:yes stop_codon:yes gene_type:complete